jgi:hypothetical protein
MTYGGFGSCAPVRVAHTEMTGFRLLIMVAFGPKGKTGAGGIHDCAIAMTSDKAHHCSKNIRRSDFQVSEWQIASAKIGMPCDKAGGQFRGYLRPSMSGIWAAVNAPTLYSSFPGKPY